jgi:hypothetical protein
MGRWWIGEGTEKRWLGGSPCLHGSTRAVPDMQNRNPMSALVDPENDAVGIRFGAMEQLPKRCIFRRLRATRKMFIEAEDGAL